MSSSLIRIRSFAKVNLALAVLGKRADGYHEIRTVFQSIDLHDDVEIRPSPRLELSCEGLESVPTEQNTVWRAAVALAKAVPPPSGAHILLRKRIPQGSGLGGGSSNAAAALLGLRRFWGLDIPMDKLRPLAAAIGSDVPFFSKGERPLALGAGRKSIPCPKFVRLTSR